jgi:uncharacterized phage protein (TIGR02220 family)
MSPKIHAEFWTDPDLEDRPPEMKLTVAWLMTNPHINMAGVTQLSHKRFTFETGLPSSWLDDALRELAKMFVRHGDKVLVRNFIRHQFGSGPKLATNNIGRALVKLIPNLPAPFQETIYGLHPELKPLASPYEALPSPLNPLQNGANGGGHPSLFDANSVPETEALQSPSKGKGTGTGTGIRTSIGTGTANGEVETAAQRAEPEEEPRVPFRWDLANEMLLFLNKKTGAEILSNRATLTEIVMRLHEVRYDVPGVQKMIVRQVALWGDDAKMRNWLKPSTLFESKKFHEYYGQRDLSADVKNAGDLRAQRTRLVELIEKSPANRESVYHSKEATEEQKAQLKKLRGELAEIDRQLSAERRGR